MTARHLGKPLGGPAIVAPCVADPSSANAPQAGSVAAGPRAGDAKASVCDHRVAISFGRTNQDAQPNAETLTLEELDLRFNVPDTTRGQLNSAEYHALDKNDREQKAIRDREKNGEYFVPAHFGGDGRRVADNIESLSGFVLDFDSGQTTGDTIEAKLAGTAYLAYTSYSHRPDDQRWRVFVPYAHPLPRVQHGPVFEHFKALFEGDLDENCRKPGQLYYTPACPADACDEYEQWYADGALFDPTAIVVPDAAGDGATRVEDKMIKGAGQDGDLVRLADALTHLDPDSRDRWVDVGMAIKHDYSDAGLPLWLTWSERSSKFDNDDAQKTWASLKPKTGEGAISCASVFGWAKAAGWDPAANGIPAGIAELNANHFVAPYGRKVLVFRQSVDPMDQTLRTEPIAPADFRLWLANRKLAIALENGAIHSIPLADAWLKHTKRRDYTAVIFSPGREIEGCFNLWRGFAVEPRPGSWECMRAHILAVICAGDERHFDYLLNWMAYAVQYPGQPAEVAIVLRGGRGTGKGIFARSFGRLFGPHFLQITQTRHLVGNFNSHLESCALLFVDEGFWAGDKAGEGVLKGLVTEPTLAIERKGLDVVHVRNCLHIMIASNSDWVVPAGPDERRFFVLDVAPERQQDREYFTPLYAEMAGDGPSAMLHDLQRHDLRGFDIRQVPPSKALGEQKLQSLGPTERWWYDKLVAAEFAFSSGPNRTAQPWGRVGTGVLHTDYEQTLRRVGTSRKSTEAELGRALRKLVPAGLRRTKVTVDRVQVPHYDLPPLPDCRTHFERLMRMEGSIDWDSGEVRA